MEYTIYKIYCKDENIKDCYVGSTKDLQNRKRTHKFDCKNKNINVYKFIKENGDFDNFEFKVIETLMCDNKNDAYIRERYWIEELKATLNTVVPSRTKKEYKQYWINSFDYSNHRKIADKKYKEHNKDKLRQKKNEKLLCECGCEYMRSHKVRHCQSKKHQNYLSLLPNLESEGS
jgi:predicted GIY-YIG superfamily endonuclease